MRRVSLPLLLVFLAGSACTRQPELQPAPAKPVAQAAISGTPFGNFVVGEPVHFQNLTIFPISSRELKDADRFISLDEGLAVGTVTIAEVGAAVQADDPFGAPTEPASENSEQAAAEVNRLMVVNSSDKPLYLMPGEVISGGQQDRTIGEEVVIQPGDNPVAIEAFCVERGRWSGRDLGHTAQMLSVVEAYGGALANESSEEAAAAANQGKFVASVGQLNQEVRLAVQQSQDQGTVWKAVEEVNLKSGNKLDSGNFSGNYGVEDVVVRLKPYHDHCQQAVNDCPQVVGVAVAVNGEIQTVDIFESTPLFKKFWPKLLKSYALDAMTSQAEGEEGRPVERICSLESCLGALKQLDEAEAGTVEMENGLTQIKRESDHVISYSLADEATEPGAAGGFGGGGGFGIHGTGFY